MKYCNGVRSVTDPLCNVQAAGKVGIYIVEPFAGSGRASVPTYALRDIYPHDELIFPYGRAYCASIKGFGSYVFTL